MPSTYSRLLYHLIFSTKNRRPWITDSFGPDLYAYMGGILRRLGGTALAFGGMDDHIHILTGLKPVHSVSSILRELKSGSSDWLHQEKNRPDFYWQEGFAAITVSPSAVESVRRYIQNQQEHHRKRSFRQELVELLKKSGIEFDERYLD
jgi:putative transposase